MRSTQQRQPLLRHRIDLQEFTTTVDDDGYPIEVWQNVATLWAAVEPISGKEYWSAAAVQAETTLKITIRYRPDVTPANRIIYDGQLLDIRTALNVEGRGRWLVLMCTATGEGWEADEKSKQGAKIYQAFTP